MKIIEGREYSVKLQPRSLDGHKGDYGHVLVVGGSAGFGGAPALTALGALRAGAGLVSAAVPASLVNGPIACIAPEAMAHPIQEYNGRIACEDFQNWLYARKPFDVIAVGPGLGQSEETDGIVHTLMTIETNRLVLDADALNIIAARDGGLAEVANVSGGHRIMTPHSGEAARLLGVEIPEILADRSGAASALAEKTGAVIVLKGHGTIVCEAGREPEKCCLGNPGMATGGSGDVLTGIIAALWGQGMTAFDAAAYGVWLHAAAGDYAAQKFGQRSIIARDIANCLGSVFV